ncbi:Asp-tRNA(Asn)/Glu-tRNA(Gln) amidotransferase subunit GatB [Patescibacteria group bacterium]|nr:Asp-tRNA(Asn)/Glu-tRNA(Gln) amidotransferase subunit GatB [Patescibacteria group bacterium]MCL5409579.1 Asp-tRNA(Asn)/Glu-tRNA(Gln) amidotransferase subunit GatB [Patescibacteria group bacterium]
MNQDGYELVIGLEVHVELNTKNKMFCNCSTDYFGQPANTHICPVCLGLPGALPIINHEAIQSCMKIGLALNCTVAENSRFERKNYFYPDLPKGFQISQYRWPLCTGGWLEVSDMNGQANKIRINRVHQEEDTGKLTHSNRNSLVDYNRSGIPLVEIVTEPDFHDVESVRDYAKKLQQIFRSLGVSNADMEKGDMRLEANVSVRPVGSQELPDYRVELKNINSFRFMVAAIEYERSRQIAALEKGEELTQETRGWNEEKKETYLQRGKEEAHDYRYFPEPDLPELQVASQVVQIKKEMPELPEAKIRRYKQDLSLPQSAAQVLASDSNLSKVFETALEISAGKLTALTVANKLINSQNGASLLPEKVVQDLLTSKEGLIEDNNEISKLAQEAIKENAQVAEIYRKGKLTAIQSLIGVVMRKSQGKADAAKVKETLEKLLNSES